ncbi:MAG: ATP synthase F1 subunit delta [Candidatus Marinimicrobia bacterium]|nr:ATP synthase F1 subunit delta [Candidatus Neomarinimicrobiota bacterium]|tara:strand:- start:895 stop:1434 length:540 start_codon:yes stop_codon:yes gene_type:complete
MENKQLVKKYALSLYQIGQKENVSDEIQKGVRLVASLYKDSSTFRYFLLTKKIADNDKKKILSDILKDLCSHYVLELMFITIDKGDIKSLRAIIDRFFVAVNSESDVIPVRIITSSALDNDERQALIANIESKLNKKISAKNEVDPKIIGGVKLMIGNKVVDGSISHQLKKIKYTLEQV